MQKRKKMGTSVPSIRRFGLDFLDRVRGDPVRFVGPPWRHLDKVAPLLVAHDAAKPCVAHAQRVHFQPHGQRRPLPEALVPYKVPGGLHRGQKTDLLLAKVLVVQALVVHERAQVLVPTVNHLGKGTNFFKKK